MVLVPSNPSPLHHDATTVLLGYRAQTRQVIDYFARLRLQMQQNLFLVFKRVETEFNESLAAPLPRMMLLGRVAMMQIVKICAISQELEQKAAVLKQLDQLLK